MTCIRWLSFLVVLILHSAHAISSLDNGVIGLPEVDCMEDRVRLTFRTEHPFTGRIFVKGMIDKDQCVNSFVGNTKSTIQFEMNNGQCNMRRSRKLGPQQKGVEQSITIIISFHNTFITKVDRAYRCTCFYMEADKVVTSRFDVSMLPTTDLIDTARMPLCTYTVRRGSVMGSIVSFATVGEPVFHVWQCESDMFSMLVHSCFVDDGNGQEKKALVDDHGGVINENVGKATCVVPANEHSVPSQLRSPVFEFHPEDEKIKNFRTFNQRMSKLMRASQLYRLVQKTCKIRCTIDSSIVPDLTYNDANNMAFSEVSVFKFADKVSTYFQCAVSTCMNSEGMCSGKTPPRCGTNGPRQSFVVPEQPISNPHRKARSLIMPASAALFARSKHNTTLKQNQNRFDDDAHTMDLAAERITVLDLDESTPENNNSAYDLSRSNMVTSDFLSIHAEGQICMSSVAATLLTAILGFSVITTTAVSVALILRKDVNKKPPKV